MVGGRLPGLLNVQLDVLLEVEAEVAVRADEDGEAVVAGLGGRRELELHLLRGHQAGHVIRRGDQVPRLLITDIHPPGRHMIIIVPIQVPVQW